jgi:GTP cyclohydrolase II
MALSVEKILNKYVKKSEELNKTVMTEEEKADWKLLFESIIEHILEDLEIVNIQSMLSEPKVLVSVDDGVGDGAVINPDSIYQINSGRGLIK